MVGLVYVNFRKQKKINKAVFEKIKKKRKSLLER